MPGRLIRIIDQEIRLKLIRSATIGVAIWVFPLMLQLSNPQILFGRPSSRVTFKMLFRRVLRAVDLLCSIIQMPNLNSCFFALGLLVVHTAPVRCTMIKVRVYYL